MVDIDITGIAPVISDASQSVRKSRPEQLHWSEVSYAAFLFRGSNGPYLQQLRPLELVSSDVIERTIRTELSQIQEVREIHFILEDDMIEIWTILKNVDYATRCKVYEAEMRIREHLPGFLFNFATSGMGDSPSLQASGYQQIFSR
jgi:hypothetical protein